MTTEARIGHGGIFEMHNGAQFQVIGEVTNISPPKLARDAVEATHTESPEGWREFIAGLKDAGEVSVELNFVASGPSDDLIRAQFDTAVASQLRITMPSSSSPTESLTCNAILTGYEPSMPIDDRMTATVTFKITGKVTYS